MHFCPVVGHSMTLHELPVTHLRSLAQEVAKKKETPVTKTEGFSGLDTLPPLKPHASICLIYEGVKLKPLEQAIYVTP